MMSICIFDKKHKLLYGNNSLDIPRKMRMGSSEIACLERSDCILVGHSKVLDVPYMLSILEKVDTKCLFKDYFKFFTYMNTSFFNGYHIQRRVPVPFSIYENKRLRFNVVERIRAIMRDDGSVLTTYAHGTVTCVPRYYLPTQLYVQYSVPKTEIEIRHAVKKFCAFNVPVLINAYTFVPPRMPVTLVRHGKGHYTLRICLSRKSRIRIVIPISRRATDVVVNASMGCTTVCDDHIEWDIRHQNQFEKAEIKYGHSLMDSSETSGPIRVRFISKVFSLSELLITEVRNSQGNMKTAWVSYTLESDLYEVRGD